MKHVESYTLAHVAAVYAVFVAASVLLLGSPFALIPAGILALGVVMVPVELGLVLFIVSCMVAIPLLHIPPTQSLALRISDIILLALAVKMIILHALRRTPASPRAVIPGRYRNALIFMAVTVLFSCVVAFSGGIGAYEVDAATSAASFYANVIWAGGRSIGYIWVFFLFARHIQGTKKQIAFVRLIFFSIFVASLYAVGEYLGVFPNLWATLPEAWRTIHIEAFGTPDVVGSFSRNHANIGITTVFGVMMGLGLIFHDRSKKYKYIVMLLVILVALFVSRKRAAYVVVFAGMLVFFLVQWKHMFRVRNALAIMAGVAIMVTAGGFIGVWNLVQEEFAPIAQNQRTGVFAYTGGRYLQWSKAASSIRQNPEILIYGRGIAYERVIGGIKILTPGRDVKRTSSHNEWLNVLTERGGLGLLALLIVVLVFTKGAWTAREDRTRRWIYHMRASYIAFMAAAIPYSLISHVFVENETVGAFPALFMALSALLLIDPPKQ